MMKNHAYNLMAQIHTEHKSLWRIKKYYEQESDCEDCRKFWEKLITDKEKHIKELEALLKAHLEKTEG